MHAFVYISSLLLVPFTLGQTAQQNSTIQGLTGQNPTCVQQCGAAGILQVGCSFTDYYCLCKNGDQLNQIIPACLAVNSTCSAADILKFEQISQETCAVLGINITIPSNLPTSGGASTTASATGSSTATNTMTVTSSKTPSGSSSAPATASSKAGAMPTMDASILATGGYAVIGAGLMALFL